jgi:DNA-binding transcriptional regulator YhcF (GntR family)
MVAPIVRLDSSLPVPAYRQIAAGLRAALVQGAMQPGQRLPPVRQLALDLGVHFNTVAVAYRMLAREGWLSLRRRSGAVVLARRCPEPETGAVEVFGRRLRELLAEWRAAGVAPAAIARDLRAAADALAARRHA